MTDYVPMTIQVPKETHTWMVGGAEMIGTSRHKFMVRIMTDAHSESQKPEGQAGLLMILRKLRAMVRVEQEASETPKSSDPETNSEAVSTKAPRNPEAPLLSRKKKPRKTPVKSKKLSSP